jgi:hypothetical protein
MGGPYKMCDQCDGPGTRCKRCPLEDEDDEANDEPVRSDASSARVWLACRYVGGGAYVCEAVYDTREQAEAHCGGRCNYTVDEHTIRSVNSSIEPTSRKVDQ